MDINYELYKVFYYVATSLSFSEASRQLFISQSAVSQSVRTLENKLNQSLFVRSTKKVQLTPEGEILLRHIEPAIHLIRRGENQLQETSTLGGGQLRIGASDTICRYFLVPYLQKFHKDFPGVHIKVSNQTSVECVSLLENGQVDLIFTNAPNSHLSDGMQKKQVAQFQDVFVANPNYFPLENRLLTFRDLLNYPLLMLTRKSTTSEFLHRLFQQHQLDLVPEIELTSNDLLLDLAGIGLGIAFVPDYCLKNSSNQLFRLNLTEELPSRQLMIAYNDRLPLSPAARQFISYFYYKGPDDGRTDCEFIRMAVLPSDGSADMSK